MFTFQFSFDQPTTAPKQTLVRTVLTSLAIHLSLTHSQIPIVQCKSCQWTHPAQTRPRVKIELSLLVFFNISRAYAPVFVFLFVFDDQQIIIIKSQRNTSGRGREKGKKLLRRSSETPTSQPPDSTPHLTTTQPSCRSRQPAPVLL